MRALAIDAQISVLTQPSGIDTLNDHYHSPVSIYLQSVTVNHRPVLRTDAFVLVVVDPLKPNLRTLSPHTHRKRLSSPPPPEHTRAKVSRWEGDAIVGRAHRVSLLFLSQLSYLDARISVYPLHLRRVR